MPPVLAGLVVLALALTLLVLAVRQVANQARDLAPGWHGFLYVNRADPALLVPRRNGFGWTLNFGHSASWHLLTALLLLPVLVAGLAALFA
ncbi:DUF5808 domain-containing protein [Actinoplanes siamensis]|uniref:DUF5808 domain-containing protein n=1 Tax=Actinoplanes siamensis TaxID=1223317 RepID=UPI001942677E|nr:DUF5808 domain-containing protein [Actinoplanes siamensis]